MTHKIHSADPDYLDGFGEVTYPQDLNNCRKCHNGADKATPQGDNWKNKPSREACGACHRNVNFDTGEGHHCDRPTMQPAPRVTAPTQSRHII